MLNIATYIASYIFSSAQENCLQTNNGNGLPFFQGYIAGADRRIHHQHQAIITSYKFNCCGNITEWGVDLNPFGYSVTFDFDFQVWRPSPTVSETRCYSLVNNFAIKETSLPSRPEIDHVARVTPPPQNQLQFQPEDVLGFYVESYGTGDVLNDNGVVLLSHPNYSSELVWFPSVDITVTQASQSGSCPYPGGTNGILSSSTHAYVAPVISISVTTYPCPPSLSIIIDPRPVPTVVPNSATIDNYSPSSATEFTTHSNENSNRDLSIRLVVGISVSTALVMVALATTTAVIVIVLYHCKIRRQYRRATVSVIANSNGGRSVGEQLDTLMPEANYPEVNPTTLRKTRLTQKVIESHFPLIFEEMKLTRR